MFDQALYRLFLFPQTFYELDAEGQEIHWDFTHQTVQPGKFFTNIGFWDGFRTSFPLLALMAPDTYHDFLEGFLNFYKETGFLPKWLAPDERGMMPGTLIDGVIADATAKNLIPDLEKDLFQAMLETAEKEDPSKHYGRQGASDYQTLGYLPSDHHESVSHTLDYSYSDFCIASLANKLQQKSVAQRYIQQSLNYQHLFDPETGYMRAKNRNGQFRPDFSPYTWGRDYAECSAIQNTLSVFHDIEGLKELMGGQTAFTDYLTKLCQDQPFFDVTGYGYEIHEMSEMATAHFGQLAISNQPSFHIPYLFRYSDKPEYTSLLIKNLREQGFRPGWQAFPGDEDNGSLSAWYIWSAIGLYPTCPGKPFYDLGIPLFNHLRLYLPQSQTWLDIYAHDNYPHFQFVTKTELDGQALQHISHEELLAAKRLDFHLSWLPNSSKE
ncbi:Alpha-1,2-mannosidase [Streptococcus gordonii]|uniref:Alpha-1,2-mannosidase n=1 Tax=Streptococcus gordonii TaxID=1302 RepID=A0A139MXY4_STRGN|nr:Alpha-1,2-mannosidase [Streptococcus gordonii]